MSRDLCGIPIGANSCAASPTWAVFALAVTFFVALTSPAQADSVTDRFKVIGSLSQGYTYADPDFIRSETLGSFRSTRYSLMGILDLDEIFTLRTEVYGESDRYISFAADTGSYLEPQILQAAGEAQLGFSTTIHAGISRLPVGLDGMTRDLGLSFRSLLKPLYQTITGLMPRSYRGVGVTWHTPLWDDELRLDAVFGEMSYNGGYEQLGRFHLPRGSIGPLIKQGINNPGTLTLPEEILRNMGAARLQLPVAGPHLTLVASGWLGTIPSDADSEERRLQMIHGALASHFDFWHGQVEYGDLITRTDGVDNLHTVSMSFENNIPVGEDFNILVDYLLDFPDWSGRRYGSYRHETLLGGLEWIPTPSVSIQGAMRWVRGEIMLMRSTRLWDWAEGISVSASYTYF